MAARELRAWESESSDSEDSYVDLLVPHAAWDSDEEDPMLKRTNPLDFNKRKQSRQGTGRCNAERDLGCTLLTVDHFRECLGFGDSDPARVSSGTLAGRHVVYGGHDFRGDVESMRSHLGFDIFKDFAANCVGTADTVWWARDALGTGPQSLSGLVGVYGLATMRNTKPRASPKVKEVFDGAHNSSNDAVMSIKVTLAMAFDEAVSHRSPTSSYKRVKLDHPACLNQPIPMSADTRLPVFVAVDLESVESGKSRGSPMDVGIAWVDLEDVRLVAPGVHARDWHSFIQARHFRFREHLRERLGLYAVGNPLDVRLGTSEIISKSECKSKIAKLFEPFTNPNPPITPVGSAPSNNVTATIEHVSRIVETRQDEVLRLANEDAAEGEEITRVEDAAEQPTPDPTLASSGAGVGSELEEEEAALDPLWWAKHMDEENYTDKMKATCLDNMDGLSCRTKQFCDLEHRFYHTCALYSVGKPCGHTTFVTDDGLLHIRGTCKAIIKHEACDDPDKCRMRGHDHPSLRRMIAHHRGIVAKFNLARSDDEQRQLALNDPKKSSNRAKRARDRRAKKAKKEAGAIAHSETGPAVDT